MSDDWYKDEMKELIKLKTELKLDGYQIADKKMASQLSKIKALALKDIQLLEQILNKIFNKLFS